ncbi:hypothetical protein BHM03_00048498 [Ensete ventricosum]|nr:hypothetical protein BHM03_00048498 [Ensete ventricosum]
MTWHTTLEMEQGRERDDFSTPNKDDSDRDLLVGMTLDSVSMFPSCISIAASVLTKLRTDDDQTLLQLLLLLLLLPPNSTDLPSPGSLLDRISGDSEPARPVDAGVLVRLSIDVQ